MTADELYFVTDGSLSHGSFEISQSADAGPDIAIVEIAVAYRHPRALEEAEVCRLLSMTGDGGLGIFVSTSPSTVVTCCAIRLPRMCLRLYILADGRTS